MHISDLLRYVAEPDDSHELRVGLVGIRELMTTTLDGHIAEMTALASECVKSRNPLNHYVVSWREGERPTNDQLQQAVDLILDVMGLTGCQALFAAHFDTRNIHLHLCVNRVDPLSLKTREVNRGFDIDAGMKAIARIEHEQGWQSEVGALYQVQDGQVVPVGAGTMPSRLPAGAKNAEVRAGDKSWARLAQERAVGVFESCGSWSELHHQLKAVGLIYLRRGSGAHIEVDGQLLKASTVNRLASLSKLEKKLGPFEPHLTEDEYYVTHSPQPYFGPPRSGIANGLRKLCECHLADNQQRGGEGLLPPLAFIGGRAAEQLRRQSIPIQARNGRRPGTGHPITDVPQFAEFQKAKRLRREQLAAARLALSREHDSEWVLLKERQARDREALLAGDWRRKGHQLNAMRAAIREDQDAVRHAMKVRQKDQRQRLRDSLQPWPTWREWLAEQGAVQLLEQIRYPRVSLVFFLGIEIAPLQVYEIPDYECSVAGDSIHYKRHGQSEVSITDRGHHITVWDSDDEENLLTAMVLAASKWQSFQVVGDEDFKMRCVKLAAQHGLQLTNAELQPALEAERIALSLPPPAPVEDIHKELPEELDDELPQEPDEDSGYFM